MTVIVGIKGRMIADGLCSLVVKQGGHVPEGIPNSENQMKIQPAPNHLPAFVDKDGNEYHPDWCGFAGSTLALEYFEDTGGADLLMMFGLKKFVVGTYRLGVSSPLNMHSRIMSGLFRVGKAFFYMGCDGTKLTITGPETDSVIGSGATKLPYVNELFFTQTDLSPRDALLAFKFMMLTKMEETVGGTMSFLEADSQVLETYPVTLDDEEKAYLLERAETALRLHTNVPKPEPKTGKKKSK